MSISSRQFILNIWLNHDSGYGKRRVLVFYEIIVHIWVIELFLKNFC